jgi:hypothetical protein
MQVLERFAIHGPAKKEGVVFPLEIPQPPAPIPRLNGGDSCRKLVDLAGVKLASIYRSDNAIERFQASSSPTTLGLGRALAWRSKFSLSVD